MNSGWLSLRLIRLTTAILVWNIAATLSAQSIYEPYFVTTLAGSAGNAGSADGIGTAARFDSPRGAALTNNDTLYVADQLNSTIRRVTASGVVTTIAGAPGQRGNADGTGGAARFSWPFGIGADVIGNIYVGDLSNHTIRRINSVAFVTTLAGSPGMPGSADGSGSMARFYFPSGVAADSATNLYVGDQFNHTIRKVSPAGLVTTIAGFPQQPGSNDGVGSAARFDIPTGLAVDAADNIYVADQNNNKVRKILPGALVTTFAGASGVAGSRDGPSTVAQFNKPLFVAVDNDGNVYTSDYNNHTIRKVTPSGDVTTIAGLAGVPGVDDGVGSAARFGGPAGLAVTSSGRLFIADDNNHTIRTAIPLLRIIRAASRKIHGDAGVFDVVIPLSGARAVESRSGPVAGEHTIVVDFNNLLTKADAEVIAGSGTLAQTTVSERRVTLSLTGAADAQVVTISLHDVTDVFDQTYPATTLQIGFLLGDASNDGLVNAGDVIQVRSHSGETVDATTFRFDVNANGAINAGDSTVVRGRSGNWLP